MESPPARRPIRAAGLRLSSAVRASSYRGGSRWLLRLLGNRLVERWRLRPPPEGMHRVDLGSGTHPRPGYVHVDSDPSAPHLEFLASDHRLPLPDSWADEVNATHMLEHVPPPVIGAFVGEWFRVLRPGGLLELHVPSASILAEVLLRDEPGAGVWAAQNAIFGYWAHPAEAAGPEALDRTPAHKILFTLGMVEQVLSRSGFIDVRDVTGENPCRHLLEWAPHIPRMCLEVRATRRPEVFEPTAGLDGDHAGPPALDLPGEPEERRETQADRRAHEPRAVLAGGSGPESGTELRHYVAALEQELRRQVEAHAELTAYVRKLGEELRAKVDAQEEVRRYVRHLEEQLRAKVDAQEEARRYVRHLEEQVRRKDAHITELTRRVGQSSKNRS